MAKDWLVAGIMSGTSADGIDVALVRIFGRGWQTKLRLAGFHAFPYRAAERAAILAACDANSISTAEIARLNFWLGCRFGDAVVEACRRSKFELSRLDLVASHGQTIYHQGRHEQYLGMSLATTLQIGEPACIAERTGVTTVGDFRVADVAAGGQGAPLVPLLDYLALRNRRVARAALNIGGIANVTLIPAGAELSDVVAFDTGPGNMVIDALAARASGGKERFDRDGRRAAKGRIIEPLLNELLTDAFYRRQPPKTAGREQYGREFVERVISRAGGAAAEDLLATATALTAETIARALRDWTANASGCQVVASGGGVHNRALMRMLRERLPHCELHLADEFGLPADAKEAMAFALLGYMTLHNQQSNVTGATGASHGVVLGKISPRGRQSHRLPAVLSARTKTKPR
jgi:anhydro-N-acetylmuramic acid kinase